MFISLYGIYHSSNKLRIAIALKIRNGHNENDIEVQVWCVIEKLIKSQCGIYNSIWDKESKILDIRTEIIPE